MIDVTMTRLLLGYVIGSLLLIAGCSSDSGNNSNEFAKESIIIQCQADCTELIQSLAQVDAEITRRFQNVNAVVAKVPLANLTSLNNIVGIKSYTKDKVILRPEPTTSAYKSLSNLKGAKTTPLNLTNIISNPAITPKNYLINNITNGVAALHRQNITGKGVIVAVIDSGTANNPEIVPALAGTVIGGENFVSDSTDEPSATSTLNDSHGTLVGSMIAAHMGIVLPNTSELILSLLEHTPQSVIALDESTSMVPMLGSAPDASIYAMKVFSAKGNGGTPSSVVIAAMDRALTLKQNYRQGTPPTPTDGDGSEDNPFIYDALNIQVVNMSLGGSTLFPGHEVEDLLVLKMLEAGITVITAAGNEGFGAFTTGSPATSVGSISVGAANSPIHERVLRDLQLGFGEGKKFRANSLMQTAFFSSRGPTTDGRVGVDLLANGLAAFAQGPLGDISFVSGTSFSSPTVAGAAALLWAGVGNSATTATNVRQALIQSANPDILDNKEDQKIDRGNGFLDAQAALSLLATMNETALPTLPILHDEPQKVLDNIQNIDLNIVNFNQNDVFTTTVTLNPGQAINYLVPTQLATAQLMVMVTGVKAELGLDQQNPLFGDGIFFTVLDAPTSTNEVLIDERINDGDRDMLFPINSPQTGIIRVAILGDWTNAGQVSTTLELSATQKILADTFADGSLSDEQSDQFNFSVNRKTRQLNFELSWTADWGTYPPHDLDLILVDPAGNFVFDAATLDIPERLTIDSPMRGKWQAIIVGYMLHGFKDEYVLRITDQNGRKLED